MIEEATKNVLIHARAIRKATILLGDRAARSIVDPIRLERAAHVECCWDFLL
jgi:hypothetical protein